MEDLQPMSLCLLAFFQGMELGGLPILMHNPVVTMLLP